MSSSIEPDFEPPFLIAEPSRQTIPFVFNAPHAGAVYPGSFLDASRLAGLALRRSEDAYVDVLFAGVTALGAPLMTARFPRAYLDVNREPYELDPRMFEGRLPPFANTRSMRVAGGLGTIPRIVADGQEIYRARLPVEEGLRRIEWLYKPYHRALRQLVHRSARGYAVVRNKPYAGGFITEHYGEPALGRHALQIEINRALYMDERSLSRRAGFAGVAADLCGAFAEVAAEISGALAPPRIAAE